jgi:DNA recombination protein RmuC
MDTFHIVLLVAVGGLACLAVWLYQRGVALRLRAAAAEQAANSELVRRQQVEEALGESARRLDAIAAEVTLAQRNAATLTAQLEAERNARKEDLDRRAEFDVQLRQAFNSHAADVLKKSNEQLVLMAREQLEAAGNKAAGVVEAKKAEIASLVTPIRDTLTRTDEKLQQIQRQWEGDRAGLLAQIQGVGQAGELLRAETARLVKALSRPEVRGRYGEVQLRRVAELAGMTNYCDFAEQESSRDEEGRLRRPDLIVRLPNDRVIAVDAKTNTYPYVEAVNAPSPQEQAEHLERFAQAVEKQVSELGRRQYWSAFEGSPEFVVMFMPGDVFLDAALSRRPDLLEHAARANVLIATPATLIGLLRAVAVGWREQRLAAEARELLDLGRELHKRAADALEHVEGLGGALRRAVEHYNRFVGSYERNLEPTLRKFEGAGAKGAKELPEPAQVEVTPRLLRGLSPDETGATSP